MEQLTEDATPKIWLRELPIINMEYTSQMRLDLESTVTSGEAVNDTVRRWKESSMLPNMQWKESRML